MRLGSTLSLGVAILFGAVAVFLARGIVQGESAPATRFVVVAAQPVAFGAALTSDNLREVPWPNEAVLDGAFASVADLVRDGRRLALAPLGRNEPVLAGKVTAPNGRATLSTQIDDGMRAVSVRVDEVRGVAGFIGPGDRVDVVLTRGEGGAQDVAAYADVLLQNTKVLAIDQFANDRQDKPTVARAVTLEVTVAQAQRVVLAQGVGRLSLILRQAGEALGGPVSRVTAGDLSGEAAFTPERPSDLDRRVDEMKRAAEQAGQRMTDLETRLRDELTRARVVQAVTPQAYAPPVSQNPIVTVTRNGSKREPYTVVTER